MDVRCEKCQTEYELDEARLKPGGVTVKCTNCGHMFRIRKRTITNVGTGASETAPPRGRPNSSRPAVSPPAMPPMPPPVPVSQPLPRPDSFLDDDGRHAQDEAPTTPDRQWLIRLDNGEQKSCRELATLQQWIIAGVVTRESLISRTGKTWKRLGDVADLGQYFAIADEARANRDRMKSPSARSAPIATVKDVPGTLPGYGAAQAAGGTILPDDDEVEGRTTRAYKNPGPGTTPPPVPQRGAARTPPMGAHAAVQHTEAAAVAPPPVPRRPATTPPPPPPKRLAATPQPPAIPQGNRATATWATDGVAPEAPGPSSGASGPFVGKLAAIPDEPAFAGRVRMAPGEDAFTSGRVRVEDDDDVLPVRRGSRAGMVVLISALVVMAAAAAVIYVMVIRTEEPAVAPVKDAAVVAMAPDAAPPIDAAAPDAAVAEPSVLEAARGELIADIEGRLRTAAQSLDGKLDGPSQALRAYMLAQLAQDLIDRASVTPDKAAADRLRQESKQIVLEAATGAQRALRAAADDAGANLAMASVLRLQGKPARDIKRYLDMARAKPDKDWVRDLALTEAMVLARDNKHEEARAAFAAIDDGDGKLETSNDVRARLHAALALTAQNKAAEAKPLVESILAAQPDHLGARTLAEKLATMVAQTDPLPPEEGTGARDGAKDGAKDGASVRPGRPTPPTTPTPAPPPPETGGGDSYDRLLARANKIADTSCAQAMPLYAKALEQKPNGVEGLTGMGYCHLDAKEYASAFSKFRAALAVSPRYEGALRGVAEAYQQMGRKEQAIEAYKAYLDVYPNDAGARRQLERLGGAPAASPAPPPATPAPEQPQAPPPQPAPADPGAGSGSG